MALFFGCQHLQVVEVYISVSLSHIRELNCHTSKKDTGSTRLAICTVPLKGVEKKDVVFYIFSSLYLGSSASYF